MNYLFCRRNTQLFIRRTDVEDLNILVVDDSPTMRQIIKGQLNQSGYYSVGLAEDGLDALDELDSGKYNFVLTDWNMPNMDGLTLIQEIRGRAKLAHLPIVVVTTRNAKLDVVTAIKAGANNYVVKPFGPAELSQKIEKVLQTTI